MTGNPICLVHVLTWSTFLPYQWTYLYDWESHLLGHLINTLPFYLTNGLTFMTGNPICLVHVLMTLSTFLPYQWTNLPLWLGIPSAWSYWLTPNHSTLPLTNLHLRLEIPKCLVHLVNTLPFHLTNGLTFMTGNPICLVHVLMTLSTFLPYQWVNLPLWLGIPSAWSTD